MAKRGIEVYPEYDKSGRWCLRIEKKRGKLTLDEIREAAREWGADFYLLVLDCFHEVCDDAQYENPSVGDCATLYQTDFLYEDKLK